MNILKASIISFVVFILLDIVWIGFLARDFYYQHLVNIGRIQDEKFQIIYWAGAAVYVLMALGLSLYILQYHTPTDGLLVLWLKAALFGFIAYGIYDMTNMATLKDWNLTLSAVDMLWGSFLCGTTACITNFLLKFI